MYAVARSVSSGSKFVPLRASFGRGINTRVTDLRPRFIRKDFEIGFRRQSTVAEGESYFTMREPLKCFTTHEIILLA